MSASHINAPVVAAGRRLSYPKFAVIVLAYLVIIQGGGILMRHLSGEDDFLSTRAVLYSMIIPLGAALAFTYGVIAYLGWMRPVLRDERPTRSWVRVVPIVFAVAIAGGIGYSALAEKGWLYVLVLLIATQFVGWGEEGMFRGIGVVTLRAHGLTEGRVALWSSLIFGAVHLTNALTHGASALLQAIMVSLAGYFFYLIRRVSRGNVLNSITHGLFDFTLLSGTAILADQTFYPGTLLPILLYPVLAVVLLIGRKRIEPAAA
ncbi:CPBP family intramembrane metalloprotease [Nocardia yamanashiensis]|uniref:CPBP family intramembrane glutamic endopeptidase n=1 Tax=Nocardia yamanashiensis TaxID=209247 RepID=UPI001E42EA3B|nr:CPBP family intramembrane glutamic endopeptidase [Nocardia yamanashiensis]UGT42709.1 CPBP family intramembrane metalloprotease [Nocardia yamanashiensis]